VAADHLPHLVPVHPLVLLWGTRGGGRGREGERGKREEEQEERRRQKDGRREYRACIADTKKSWKTVLSNSLAIPVSRVYKHPVDD